MLSNQNKIRIIGGKWRTRSITFSNSTGLRPTPNRVRETVFNWLGQDLTGTTCLDLFAGSGAMGFEASSRGAEQVVMVESDPKVFCTLQSNLQKLEAIQIEVVLIDALKFIASNQKLFDIIFLDPPYQLDLLSKMLSLILPHLKKHGIVYVEDCNLLEFGGDWLVWRYGRAGKVHYQLLKYEKNE